MVDWRPAGLIAKAAGGVLLAAAILVVGSGRAAAEPDPEPAEVRSGGASGDEIAVSAREQVGKTLRYDPDYRALDYPNGDVPIEVGVCTDVVIRALRAARSLDLQRLVHEDMSRRFEAYPKIWGLERPDRNIDHRRVPNLQTFFKRKGFALPVSDRPEDYRPGDLVTCTVPRNRPHIMIVSNRTSAAGVPLVIHNIGAGTREEDRLFEFPITGHYRLPSARSPSPRPAEAGASSEGDAPTGEK